MDAMGCVPVRSAGPSPMTGSEAWSKELKGVCRNGNNTGGFSRGSVQGTLTIMTIVDEGHYMKISALARFVC